MVLETLTPIRSTYLRSSDFGISAGTVDGVSTGGSKGISSGFTASFGITGALVDDVTAGIFAAFAVAGAAAGALNSGGTGADLAGSVAVTTAGFVTAAGGWLTG